MNKAQIVTTITFSLLMLAPTAIPAFAQGTGVDVTFVSETVRQCK